MGTPKTPPFWVQVHSTFDAFKRLLDQVHVYSMKCKKAIPHTYIQNTLIHVIGARERGEERTWEVGTLLEDLFTCYQVVMSY
jgi:hypothetical protein